MKIKIKKEFKTEILVVGTGIAGLIATERALKKRKRVCLVTNKKLCGGASYFPLKGTLGIQVTKDKDDYERYYEDIVKMGNGMENPELIKTYISNIKNSLYLLNKIGFEPWLRKDSRPACFAKYSRDIYLINNWKKAKERCKRKLKNHRGLNILENSTLVRIVTKDKRVVGAIFQCKQNFIFVKSKVIILATGGITKEQLEKGTVVYPMGCRAFLSPWFNEKGEEIYSGRFNIGATTINLPRIAIKNRGDEAGFYKELDRVMEMCKENSVFRAHYLEKTQAEMAPILWQSGALAEKQPKETIKDLIWGGYATVSIGYIGLSEVSQLLYGEDFAYNEEIYEKTFNILKYISEKVAQFKVETNLGFALYGTPSESLCDRFARIDREEFGDIEGITDKGYYDNSFHVSSHININPFEKLRLEALGHQYSKGGHISYIETDSLKNNLEAIIEILRYAKEIGIHYMGINQPVDKCHVCGFKGEFLATERGFECPQCGNHENDKMSVIRRVCGYLSQPNARPFNKGKQKEIISRVKHN